MGATTEKHMNFKEIAAIFARPFRVSGDSRSFEFISSGFDASILGADIAVVGILILVAKILSAVFDPVVGSMIDRSKSKRGKFKSRY